MTVFDSFELAGWRTQALVTHRGGRPPVKETGSRGARAYRLITALIAKDAMYEPPRHLPSLGQWRLERCGINSYLPAQRAIQYLLVSRRFL